MATRTTVPVSPAHRAVLSMLRANLDTSRLPVGDGQRPTKTPDTAELCEPPYVMLFSIAGGVVDGPLNDSQVDRILRFQITAVGRTQTEALVGRDLADQLMLRENVTVPNRHVRNLTGIFASEGTRRDDDLPTPLFYAFAVYELDTVPA